MALVNGGNMLIAAMATIALMIVVVLVMLVSVFNLDGLLSISLADLAGSKQIPAPEALVEGATTEEVVEDEMTKEEARQLLGFVNYPVVSFMVDQISVFSPQAIESITPLSEEEIQKRCASFGIPFNHTKCVRAERSCAYDLSSNEEHDRCLSSYGYHLGVRIQ